MRKVSNRLAGIDNDGETKKYAIEISEDEDLDDFPLNDFNPNEESAPTSEVTLDPISSVVETMA